MKNEKINKIKTHFEENKKLYFVGAGCLATGVLIGYGLHKAPIQILNTVSPNVSPTFNNTNINNVYVNAITGRGRPGNWIMCNETRDVFGSHRLAAQIMGLSETNLSQHMHGKQPSVNEYTFTGLDSVRVP